jgi:hypothetical protein
MWTLCSITLVLALAQAQPGSGRMLELEGELRLRDDVPYLSTGDGEIRLGGETSPIDETLRDPRIAGRRFRVKGKRLPSGAFDVEEFFVVRDGKALRLVYFCAVCNITSYHPGDCDCCREPTVPIEISQTDPRVYHPEVKARPPE